MAGYRRDVGSLRAETGHEQRELSTGSSRRQWWPSWVLKSGPWDAEFPELCAAAGKATTAAAFAAAGQFPGAAATAAGSAGAGAATAGTAGAAGAYAAAAGRLPRVRSTGGV